MSDTPSPIPPPPSPSDVKPVDWKAEYDEMRGIARKWEQRSKRNNTAIGRALEDIAESLRIIAGRNETNERH